jgi:hypothetical protein
MPPDNVKTSIKGFRVYSEFDLKKMCNGINMSKHNLQQRYITD